MARLKQPPAPGGTGTLLTELSGGALDLQQHHGHSAHRRRERCRGGSRALRVNPKARVPALVTPEGTLTETPAILAFIAQSYPASQLAPLADPFQFAQVQSFNSYLCSTVHVAHAHRLRGTRWADDPAAIEAMKKKVPQSVGDCFELIEHELLRGPWVMGAALGICDYYLFTIAQWLEGDGVDPARFPKVAAHRQRLRNDPLVQRVLAAEAA